MTDTIRTIETEIKKIVPGYTLEYEFLDERLNTLYQGEQRMENIAKSISLLAIFLSCLGLLGLASFTAESRTKEIGIRKVLGAPVGGIILMLSKQFTKWILLANAIAWPLAYYFMDRWLKNFAYRIDLEIWTFVLSGIFVLFMAILTVCYQSIKAATANPVDSLRYE
jgi:putative ABC transport system permease protein